MMTWRISLLGDAAIGVGAQEHARDRASYSEPLNDRGVAKALLPGTSHLEGSF
jgi:hypothetical protein